MNTIYKTAFLAGIFGVGFIPLKSMAQTAVADSILNPHINVEREYTPIIQDATKINTTPTRHQADATQFPFVFENSVPLLRNLPNTILDQGSGSIDTEIDYNKHKGYLTLGGGTRMNLEGNLGYRFIETDKDQLDLFAMHNSTDGNVDFLNANPLLKKAKAKNMENFVKAKYSHQFSALKWYLGASFLNNSFNYYGNPYWNPLVTSPIVDNIEKKQGVNIVTAETGVKSDENADIEYGVDVKYNYISYKYGPNIKNDGPRANIIDGSAFLAKSIATDQKIGIKVGAMYQSIDKVSFPVDATTNFVNLKLFRANPYYQINSDNISLILGANVNYALDINDKFLISPNVNASWMFNDRSKLYLNVDGGINDNNLVTIFRENRYINPNSRIDISKTLYNALLGIKTGSLEGFEFDVHGGYKYTKDEHLFTAGNNESWANVSTPIYANLGTGNFGGSVKTYLIPYTNLILEANAYFYNVSKYSSLNTSDPTIKKAWGLPTFKLNAGVDFTFVPKMVLGIDYIFESGRKNYIAGNSLDMKEINELNFRAIYNFNSVLAVYGRVSNILNQKYEQYYGYTIQGTNIWGGVSFKF